MSNVSNIQIFNSFLNRFKNRIHTLLNVNQDDAEDIKRYLDEEERRVYEGPDAPDGVYSVTTILDERDTDKGGLKYWKRNNNGRGDNADWNHLLHYKTNRGTLAHHAALNRFDHKFQHGPSMWTDDEQESSEELAAHDNDDDYLYSIIQDKGYVEDWEGYLILRGNEDFNLDELLDQDLEYVQEEFDRICRERGIKASTVEEVEAMFALPPGTDHEGFGGQADLLYTDPETGEHVVADLKTSKRIYDKHKYQIAAYAQAAKEDPNLNGDYIDRCEIIRIHPDSKESEVYVLEDFEEYWEDFAELTRKASQQ